MLRIDFNVISAYSLRLRGENPIITIKGVSDVANLYGRLVADIQTSATGAEYSISTCYNALWQNGRLFEKNYFFVFSSDNSKRSQVDSYIISVI